MRLAIAVTALLAAFAAGLARAGDGFDGIVKSLERGYGAERTKIPLMGLANVVMKVAKPYGVSGFKFAVFEDLDLTYEQEREFFEIVTSSVGKKWTPMIRTRSVSRGELSAIYVRPTGKKMSMLLVNYEPGEATVIQMKVDPEVFSEWMKFPSQVGHRMMSSDGGDWRAERREPLDDQENMDGY